MAADNILTSALTETATKIWNQFKCDSALNVPCPAFLIIYTSFIIVFKMVIFTLWAPIAPFEMDIYNFDLLILSQVHGNGPKVTQ